MKSLLVIAIVLSITVNAYALENRPPKYVCDPGSVAEVSVYYFPKNLNGIAQMRATSQVNFLLFSLLQCINEMKERTGDQFEAFDIRPFSHDGMFVATFELRQVKK
jgi:hypothetical protein